MGEKILGSELKELIERQDGTKALVVGNDVYDKFTFAPEVVKFTAKQYVFLNTYKLGVPLAEAAAKAQMSLESVERFLKKPETEAWLKDRALKDHIKTEWEEPGKWWQKMDEVVEGKPTEKLQFEALKEIGDRIVPKTSRNAEPGNVKVEINISPEALERSKERRQWIEGQIVP